MLKFSIIIPVYNMEQYLGECLDSVIGQTYKNLEIICVNDGSKDSSLDILKEYEKKDNRIKIIDKENDGVSMARNDGISVATGDYIIFVDSDDTIEPDYIEKIVADTEKHSPDLLVISDYDWYQRKREVLGALPTWALGIKKSFLDKYSDIRFPEHLQVCEDGLFSHQLLALTDNVSFIPQAHYFYRQREGSSEHSINHVRLANNIERWFEILDNFYTKHKVINDNKLHILSFIRVEPFYRMYSVNFTDEERKSIADIVLRFVKKYKLLKSPYKKMFDTDFKFFIQSESCSDFNSRKFKYYKFQYRKCSLLKYLTFGHTRHYYEQKQMDMANRLK